MSRADDKATTLLHLKLAAHRHRCRTFVTTHLDGAIANARRDDSYMGNRQLAKLLWVHAHPDRWNRQWVALAVARHASLTCQCGAPATRLQFLTGFCRKHASRAIALRAPRLRLIEQGHSEFESRTKEIEASRKQQQHAPWYAKLGKSRTP